MDRSILHVDMNSCYASIEEHENPALKGHPMAVGGDVAARHGIILAANQEAKRMGVKTTMTIWQAKQLCPSLVLVPPRMGLYQQYSQAARQIYREYTDLHEAAGLDESYLDVTACCGSSGGLSVAQEINQRIKAELGITVSVGVSWNKIYAKLGSDYKKPDGVTVFDRSNYRQLVYPLPASALLMVGKVTGRRLDQLGIHTIGDIAAMDERTLHSYLGKMGSTLLRYARGEDDTPVVPDDSAEEVKSVGNSTTTPHDICTDEEARIVLYELAESVGRRLRKRQLKGSVLEVSMRTVDLRWHSRQKKLCFATNITQEIAEESYRLFRELCHWKQPLRSLGICCSELVDSKAPEQLTLFQDDGKRSKLKKADAAVDEIRSRFGNLSVQRGILLQKKEE